MKIHIKQEASRVFQQVSRAKAAGLPATLTTDEWIERVYQFGGLCAYCQAVPFDSLDHLIPFTLRGGTVADNCVPICQRCNARKNGRAMCDKDASFDEKIAQIRAALQKNSYLPVPETEESDQSRCKYCTRPIEIKEIGPYKREYCSERCRQAAYRQRQKERKVEAAHDTALTERIAELEAEREQSMQEMKQLQKRFREHQQLTSNNLSQLYGELARYRKIVDLSDRQKMIAEFMLVGEEIGYKPLSSVDVRPGPHAWYAFSQTADTEQLGAAIVAAKNVYKQLADLQTTKEVAVLNALVADLRQKLRECEKRNKPSSRDDA